MFYQPLLLKSINKIDFEEEITLSLSIMSDSGKGESVGCQLLKLLKGSNR